jgi:hypothetical protein
MFAILSFACVACADDDDESNARNERDAGKRLDAPTRPSAARARATTIAAAKP